MSRQCQEVSLFNAVRGRGVAYTHINSWKNGPSNRQRLYLHAEITPCNCGKFKLIAVAFNYTQHVKWLLSMDLRF
jgi:hypothetical protein